MVTFTPSQAQLTVSVIELVFTTTLTINTSADPVAQKTPFTIFGRLTFREGGTDRGMTGRVITLKSNGFPIGSAVTDGNGDYVISVQIDEAGSFTMLAEFAGEVGLSASNAFLPIGVDGQTLGLILGLGLLAAVVFSK